MKYISDFEFGSHEESTLYQGVLNKEVLYSEGVVYLSTQFLDVIAVMLLNSGALEGYNTPDELFITFRSIFANILMA